MGGVRRNWMAYGAHKAGYLFGDAVELRDVVKKIIFYRSALCARPNHT